MLENARIKEVSLACGYKLKQQPNAVEDLNPYVYQTARELIAETKVRTLDTEIDAIEEALAKVVQSSLYHKHLREVQQDLRGQRAKYQHEWDAIRAERDAAA